MMTVRTHHIPNTLLVSLLGAATPCGCGDSDGAAADSTPSDAATEAESGTTSDPTTGAQTTSEATSSSEATSDSSGSTGEPMRLYEPEVGFKTIVAGGVEFAYFESGAGPLVLLLHGFPDTAHTWDDLRPRLVDAGYRTVAPFMRGYAPSEILPGDDYGVVALGNDVVNLIEALGEDSAIVIGHDWGASAAYAAANIAPERVARLVTLAIPHPLAYVKHPDAVNASPHFAELAQPDAAASFALDDFHRVDELYSLWAPTWEFTADELEPVKNAFVAEGCLAGALGYYRAFATNMPDPILFQQTSVRTLSFSGSVDGASDQSVWVDQADGFTVPVQVVTLEVGHFVHREAPDDVAEAILAFLAAP